MCYAIKESSCLGLQLQTGGKFHLRLNTGRRPIVHKYREGKMKNSEERVKQYVKLLEWKRLELYACRESPALSHRWAFRAGRKTLRASAAVGRFLCTFFMQDSVSFGRKGKEPWEGGPRPRGCYSPRLDTTAGTEMRPAAHSPSWDPSSLLTGQRPWPADSTLTVGVS